MSTTFLNFFQFILNELKIFFDLQLKSIIMLTRSLTVFRY